MKPTWQAILIELAITLFLASLVWRITSNLLLGVLVFFISGLAFVRVHWQVATGKIALVNGKVIKLKEEEDPAQRRRRAVTMLLLLLAIAFFIGVTWLLSVFRDQPVH